MPGVSSRQPVSGMHGIGKIHLKFKPKPKKKFPFGALLFAGAVVSYLMVYLYSIPWSRHKIAIPILRAVVLSYGLLSKVITKKYLTLNGIHSSVLVFKDTDGISNIMADDLPDALFGQGYAHASDHLFSMEMRRRSAKGQLSEVEGYLSLPSDRLARVFNLKGLAMKDLLAESPENIQLLQSYSSGVNAFISSRRLPSLSLLISGILRIDEWTPQDTLLLIRYDAIVSSSALQRSILNATVHYGINPDAASELLAAMEGTIADSIFTEPADNFHQTYLTSALETVWAAFTSKFQSPTLAVSLSTLVSVHSFCPDPLCDAIIFSQDGSFNHWHVNNVHAGSIRFTGAAKPGIPFVQHGYNSAAAWTVLSTDSSSEHRLVEEIVRQTPQGGLQARVDNFLFQDNNLQNMGCETTTEDSSEVGYQSCVGEEDIESTCEAAVEINNHIKSFYWCSVNSSYESIPVRGNDVDNVEPVMESYHGPIITAALANSDARYQGKVISLDSPLLKQRISIGYLKDINTANDTKLLSSINGDTSAVWHVLYITKEIIGYGRVGNYSDFVILKGTSEDRYVISSRSGQIKKRISGLLNTPASSSVIDFHTNIQCDGSSPDTVWFVKLILETLEHIIEKAETPTAVESRATEIATDMLRAYIANPEDDAATVFVETLVYSMKRILLGPLQRDPDIYRSIYAKKDYATLKGSQTYKQLLTSDSIWLFRLLEKSQGNGSWWVNESSGLEALTLRSVSEAYRSAEKYNGPSTASWSWSRAHISYITRSLKFPFTPAGVDFAKALIAGPYKMSGNTDSIFQNSYDANLEASPAYGHPLTSKSCLRSTFRFICSNDV